MPRTSPLSPDQRDAYQRDGLVQLSRAVDPTAARAMAAALWQALERRDGVRANAPETWRIHRPAGLGPMAKSGVFAAMGSPVVNAALDQILGEGWICPPHWGVPLITFPESGKRWDVPREAWHLDVPAEQGGPNIGRVFLMLTSIAPQGGGTLVVTGSHHLAAQLAARDGVLRSAEVTQRLRVHPWFAALTMKGHDDDRVRRFMADGEEIDGVHVRVAEMTGEPGDVWLMHPSLMHTASPNVSQGPRMMLTQWIDGPPRKGQAAAAPAGMGPM